MEEPADCSFGFETAGCQWAGTPMKAPILLILSLLALSGCVGTTKAKSGPGEDSDGRPVQYVTPEQMAHMTQVERDAMHAVTGGAATYYPGRPGYDPTPN